MKYLLILLIFPFFVMGEKLPQKISELNSVTFAMMITKYSYTKYTIKMEEKEKRYPNHRPQYSQWDRRKKTITLYPPKKINQDYISLFMVRGIAHAALYDSGRYGSSEETAQDNECMVKAVQIMKLNQMLKENKKLSKKEIPGIAASPLCNEITIDTPERALKKYIIHFNSIMVKKVLAMGARCPKYKNQDTIRYFHRLLKEKK